MNSWNGKTSAFMRTSANVLILNFLWVLFSIPGITIGPSTVAMTSVVKRWYLDGETSVIRCYIKEFKKNSKQGFLVGTGWIFIGVVLLLDIFFFLHIPSPLKMVFLTIAGMVLLIYLIITVFVFPILASYSTKGFAVIKQAFTFSFLDIKSTIAILLLWMGGGTLFFYFPFLIFIVVVPITMITFRFAIQSFELMERYPKIKLKYVYMGNDKIENL